MVGPLAVRIEISMSNRSASRQNVEKMEEIAHLLVRIPALRGACELDLLVFFHRHPRVLLTNEQLAALVGYDRKQVATTIDAFVEAGLMERNKNPTHAARLYVLLLDGQPGGGLTMLLKLASTRQGRLDILRALNAQRQRTQAQENRKLHAIA